MLVRAFKLFSRSTRAEGFLRFKFSLFRCYNSKLTYCKNYRKIGWFLGQFAGNLKSAKKERNWNTPFMRSKNWMSQRTYVQTDKVICRCTFLPSSVSITCCEVLAGVAPAGPPVAGAVQVTTAVLAAPRSYSRNTTTDFKVHCLYV